MIEQRHVTALDVKTDEKRKKKSIKVVLKKTKKQYMYIYIYIRMVCVPVVYAPYVCVCERRRGGWKCNFSLFSLLPLSPFLYNFSFDFYCCFY